MRNYTANKVACFTQMERHSTPLLGLYCSAGAMPGWRWHGAGFTLGSLGVLLFDARGGSEFEVRRVVLGPSQGILERRSVSFEKEFLTQQESQFVT